MRSVFDGLQVKILKPSDGGKVRVVVSRTEGPIRELESQEPVSLGIGCLPEHLETSSDLGSEETGEAEDVFQVLRRAGSHKEKSGPSS